MEPLEENTFEQSHPIVNGLNPQGYIGNTQAGSHHFIDVYCANCGTLFVKAADIYRIKDGCFWAYNYNREAVNQGPMGFNGRKKEREARAYCNKCRIRVGNIYPDGHTSSVAPHHVLAAKFFPNQTGLRVPATRWSGDPSKNAPERAEDAAPSGLVRCEMEEQLIREAADLGLLEYSTEHVNALRDAGLIRLRFMEGKDEEETEELRQFRHMFLKYANIKTGKDDWEHTQFIVLIASFGLNEQWTKFIFDAIGLVTKPIGLKLLHKKVEDLVLNRMAQNKHVQELRQSQPDVLLRRLESALRLESGALESNHRLAVKDLYSSSQLTINDQRKGYFISLDMKSSNFNILRLLGCTGLPAAQNWEELLVRCCPPRTDAEAFRFAARNKWLRVKILGKVMPKRTKFCQYALMSFICASLIEAQLKLADNEPFLFSCDEIIIPCSEKLAQCKALVQDALGALFPRQLVELLRCSAVILKEFDFSEEMSEKQRTQQRLERESLLASPSKLPPPKPANGGWTELEDKFPEKFESPSVPHDAERDAERSSFFVRFDENSMPQTKGIPYYLRFSALKQAKLFDPARAFKNIEKKNFPMRDPARQRCRYFLKGKCNKGKNCSFVHE